MKQGGSARRRRRLVGLLAIVPLLAITVVLPVAGFVVARGIESAVAGELRQGQADLEAGLHLLEDAYRQQRPGLVAGADASFARSAGHFRHAASRVPVLDQRAAAVIPGPVQSPLRALDSVVAMGSRLAETGAVAGQLLLDGGLAGRPATAGPAQVSALLEQLRGGLRAAWQAAQVVDPRAVPAGDRAALVKVQTELGVAVAALDRLWPSLPALQEVLGFNGPRTYLVEQVNPAELRSGGGFIGTVSVLHTDHGHLALDKSLPVEAFDLCDAAACVHRRPQPWQPGYVAPPPELAGYPLPIYSRLTAWSLEDSGFFPDFATNAGTAAAFTRQLLGFRPDGVVAIDYYAVGSLLELTGPIALPAYRVTLDAHNFVDTVVKLDLDRDPQHKDVIAAAATQMVTRLSHLPPAELPRALGLLQQAVAARHLQAHLDSDVAEAELRREGLSDAFNPAGASDFLLETEDNYGGSKADAFLERRYRVTLSRSGPLLHHEVVIDLVDRAPWDRPYIGPHYYAYVRLYVPASATGVSLRSTPSTEYPPVRAPARRGQAPPAGAQVAGGWIFIDVGPPLSGRYELTFEYDTAWTPGPDGEHLITWQKQPGTVADHVDLTWRSGTTVLTRAGNLAVDRVLRLGDGRLTFTEASAPSPER